MAPGSAGRRPAPRAAAGFTLIEILVALTILAMVLGATLEVFSTGIAALGTGEQYARAVAVARAKLDETTAGAAGDGEGLAAGVHGGRLGDGDAALAYEVTVEPYGGDELGDVAASRLEPLLVTARVFWTDAGRDREVRLTTLEVVRRR